MSGPQMRDNTQLHELAPEKGFITVHPSAPTNPLGGFWEPGLYPTVSNVLDDLVEAFKVDTKRVHFTGFSQGGMMTWWFLCNRQDILASAAPVAGAIGPTTCFGPSWQPRVPILSMNGLTDSASTAGEATKQVETVVSALSLSGGDVIEGDGHYSRKRWTGEGGMVLDFIEHDYGGQPVLAGHCIPGGIDVEGGPHNYGLNATTCTTGEIALHWGETVLQWFIDHPKP